MVQSAEKNKQEQDALFALLQGKELTPEQKIIIDAMGGVNIGQKKTSATGAKSSTRKKELSWRSYIRSYSGPPIVYSGQPFVYNGKTRIVPRGALYLPKNDDEPAMLVLARNGEAIDINSIPMANSDQTPNKAKKSLSSATQMLDRAQKTGYQEQNKSFEIKKGLGQIVGNEGLYGGVKRAAGGAYGGVKAVGAGLLGTLATGSLLPLLAGGLYGAKKVIGGALGGLGIAAGGIMKGIGNVTGITPAIGKAWGGLKSKVGMGGPTKAERAGPLTNGQFINFEAKLFGYIDKEVNRDKRRLERMKRQSEYDEEAADESRGGERPGTPVRDGGPEKKPMSGLMKGLLVLGGIVALAAAITAIVVYKDELLKIWDEFGTALKVGAAIITGLAIKNFLNNLGGGGGGGGGYKNPKSGTGPDKTGLNRARHAAGTVIDGKKVGGQFMKVEKGAIKGIITKSIGKRIAGVAAGSIPVVGFALGGFDSISRLIAGDYVGAGISAGSAGASFIPIAGTAIAVAGAVTNMIRDVYNEVYGVYPEDDDPADVTDRMTEIANMAWDELNIKMTKPGSTELLREYATKGTPTLRRSAIMRQLPGKLAGEGYKKEEIAAILDSISITKREGGNVNAVTSELADTIAANALAILGKNKEEADGPDETEADREDAEQGKAMRSNSRAADRDRDDAAQGEEMRSKSRRAGNVDNGVTVATTKQGESVVEASRQPQASASNQASASTIPPRVSEAAEKAIITLPVKVLEGPPMVMPSREPGQGSAPGMIQTRPNDSTLKSAYNNLNASRQMAYT